MTSRIIFPAWLAAFTDDAMIRKINGALCAILQDEILTCIFSRILVWNEK